MKEADVVHALAALAQVNRLRVFRHLVQAGRAGATPGQIGESLSLPNATLSFHLRELSLARLIQAQRDGRHLIYRVQFKQMNALLGYLTKNCCQGAEDCLNPSNASCAD